MMSRFKKIIAVMLILSLCLCGPSVQYASAKNIYFSGEYRMKIGPEEYFILRLHQYPSPKGKKVGSYEFIYNNKGGGDHVWGRGKLTRIGTNKYKDSKTIFKIYKKKLVFKNSRDLSGTYKLWKRFPRS